MLLFSFFLLFLTMQIFVLNNQITNSKQIKKMSDIEYLAKFKSLTNSGKSILDSCNIVFSINSNSIFRNIKKIEELFLQNGYSKSLSSIMDGIFSISIESGLSIDQILKNTIISIESQIDIDNQLKVITSASKKTITILKVLPIFSILLSLFLGVNYFEAIFLNNFGIISLIIGILFYLAGNFWVKKILC